MLTSDDTTNTSYDCHYGQMSSSLARKNFSELLLERPFLVLRRMEYTKYVCVNNDGIGWWIGGFDDTHNTPPGVGNVYYEPALVTCPLSQTCE